MERSQVFPFMNHQPRRARMWLCSPAPKEGRNLLSPLLEQHWWKRSFTFLPGHRLWFPLTNQCHLGLMELVPGLCVGLEPFPWRGQHGRLPSRPLALPPSPCSAEVAHPLPRPGCWGALLSACYLLPARSLPGSRLSLTGIPVVSRTD